MCYTIPMTETKTRRPVGRPPKPDAERRVGVHLRLPAALLSEVDAALAEGATRTDLIEAAVRTELHRRATAESALSPALKQKMIADLRDAGWREVGRDVHDVLCRVRVATMQDDGPYVGLLHCAFCGLMYRPEKER